MVDEQSSGLISKRTCVCRTKIILLGCCLLVLVQYLANSIIYANYRSPWVLVAMGFGEEISRASVHRIVTTETPKPLCPIIPPDLKGRLVVNTQVPAWAYLEEEQSHLLPGGRYKPANCTARHRVAIIIPYRDRELHLKILLQNLHPFLQRQQLDYGIYVVEMEPSVKFNRAMLMNIGFVEATRLYDYQCYIFHDVDLIPEDDRNLYTCPQLPRHMSAAIDRHNYRTLYQQIFGGVSAITKEHFRKINGFSNKFFGWGGEDDDMYARILYSNLTVTRYSNVVARYKMLLHKKDTPNPERLKLLRSVKSRRLKDGVNSLKYSLLSVEHRPLYTWIYVSVNMTEVMGGDTVVPVTNNLNKRRKQTPSASSLRPTPKPELQQTQQSRRQNIPRPSSKNMPQVIYQTIPKPSGRSAQQPHGQNIEQPGNQIVQQQNKQIILQPKGQNIQQPNCQNILEPSGNNIEKPSYQTIQQPSGQINKQTSGNNIQNPSDQTVQQPSEQNSQQRSRQTIQQPHNQQPEQPRRDQVHQVNRQPSNDGTIPSHAVKQVRKTSDQIKRVKVVKNQRHIAQRKKKKARSPPTRVSWIPVEFEGVLPTNLNTPEHP